MAFNQGLDPFSAARLPRGGVIERLGHGPGVAVADAKDPPPWLHAGLYPFPVTEHVRPDHIQPDDLVKVVVVDLP
ncbi:hypothetical protein [Nocardia gipuzkoensis]